MRMDRALSDLEERCEDHHVRCPHLAAHTWDRTRPSAHSVPSTDGQQATESSLPSRAPVERAALPRGRVNLPCISWTWRSAGQTGQVYRSFTLTWWRVFMYLKNASPSRSCLGAHW